MKDGRILFKVIEKAREGGYEVPCNPCLRENYPMDFALAEQSGHYYSVIFSSDFAKAYWGEKLVYKTDGKSIRAYYENDPYYNDNKEDREWQIKAMENSLGIVKFKYYQHQMLTEIQEGKCPLQYLEKFL